MTKLSERITHTTWTEEDCAILERVYGSSQPSWVYRNGQLAVAPLDGFDWRSLAVDWRDADKMTRLSTLVGVPPASREVLMALKELRS